MPLLNRNKSLNTEPIKNNQLIKENWNVFKSRDVGFIRLNINSLLTKICEPGQ